MLQDVATGPSQQRGPPRSEDLYIRGVRAPNAATQSHLQRNSEQISYDFVISVGFEPCASGSLHRS